MNAKGEYAERAAEVREPTRITTSIPDSVFARQIQVIPDQELHRRKVAIALMERLAREYVDRRAVELEALAGEAVLLEDAARDRERAAEYRKIGQEIGTLARRLRGG